MRLKGWMVKPLIILILLLLHSFLCLKRRTYKATNLIWLLKSEGVLFYNETWEEFHFGETNDARYREGFNSPYLEALEALKAWDILEVLEGALDFFFAGEAAALIVGLILRLVDIVAMTILSNSGKRALKTMNIFIFVAKLTSTMLSLGFFAR